MALAKALITCRKVEQKNITLPETDSASLNLQFSCLVNVHERLKMDIITEYTETSVINVSNGVFDDILSQTRFFIITGSEIYN